MTAAAVELHRYRMRDGETPIDLSVSHIHNITFES